MAFDAYLLFGDFAGNVQDKKEKAWSGLIS
jgi:hypothetical protein